METISVVVLLAECLPQTSDCQKSVHQHFEDLLYEELENWL